MVSSTAETHGCGHRLAWEKVLARQPLRWGERENSSPNAAETKKNKVAIAASLESCEGKREESNKLTKTHFAATVSLGRTQS